MMETISVIVRISYNWLTGTPTVVVSLEASLWLLVPITVQTGMVT